MMIGHDTRATVWLRHVVVYFWNTVNSRKTDTIEDMGSLGLRKGNLEPGTPVKIQSASALMSLRPTYIKQPTFITRGNCNSA